VEQVIQEEEEKQVIVQIVIQIIIIIEIMEAEIEHVVSKNIFLFFI